MSHVLNEAQRESPQTKRGIFFWPRRRLHSTSRRPKKSTLQYELTRVRTKVKLAANATRRRGGLVGRPRACYDVSLVIPTARGSAMCLLKINGSPVHLFPKRKPRRFLVQ